MLDLRPGRWEDVLDGVECDAMITDPPWSGVVADPGVACTLWCG